MQKHGQRTAALRDMPLATRLLTGNNIIFPAYLYCQKAQFVPECSPDFQIALGYYCSIFDVKGVQLYAYMQPVLQE